ncbi:nuclear transport factor 2 family protein [Ruegeria arenilitoris]|uniref:nuclear transport factor 2 family protein n=1 Tax=Ruegeria arenilitoris TaxID=1173585 RepID=UPI00147A0997|nr:nuclear transport factor 2 family protein [Ruegeria arenilitoris]
MSAKHLFKTAATALLLALSSPAFADLRTITTETEASIKLAEGFYQDVLVYRNLNNFSKYIGKTYIQHATAYGDGPVELIKAVSGELTADPDVQVDLYRTIAEDDYVAIHSVWTTSSGEQYVYVDIWRVENGLLVEHWDHYQQVPAESANANTMFQGPAADIYSKQDTDQNRERAIAVLSTFNNPSDTSAVENYVSAETYIQHNPYVPDGRDAFIGYLDSMAGEGKRYETQFAKTIAMGDFVLVHSKVTDPSVEGDLGIGCMDIFRFNDEGLIVEHWDIEEAQIGVSANENDVFGYPAE